MMTVEVAALELIPAEFDDQGFGLLPCTFTCPENGKTCDFSCVISCLKSG